jgi:formylglycine-generating enzyme required for sulfatase activity
MHGKRGIKIMRVFTVALASVAFCVVGCSTGTSRTDEKRPDPAAGEKPGGSEGDVARKAPEPAAAVETPAVKPAAKKAGPALKIPKITAVTTEELLKRYTGMLDQLRTELAAKVPQVDQMKRQAIEAASKPVAAASTQVENTVYTRDKKSRDQKLKAANEALSLAGSRLHKILDELKLREFLADDALDAKFTKYVVLLEATPKGLAEYASAGTEQAALVERMLSDADLMKQMLVADGARAARVGRGYSPARYGPAMKIYTDIQKASAKASGGVLQRLALAIALEHAVPHLQRNATALINAPATVDPVKRFLSYEKAYLGGELDEAFDRLSAWDLRFVVDGEEPDEISAWGREMLRNYRPDRICTSNYRMRYMGIVGTDVRYGSEDVKYDRPELQVFQNILVNGGLCGRRAFFGGFILRAFGIPTTARPSRGHAALARWTPDRGWIVKLGPPWGAGWTTTRYIKDSHFLATTRARANTKAFMQVKRAQWVGDVLGEKRTFGLQDKGTPAFWNGLALYTQQTIRKESKVVTLDALDTELGESNILTAAQKVLASPVTPEDKEITYGKDGVISIPAAAYSNRSSKPSGDTPEVSAIKSFAGGLQIFLWRFSAESPTVLRGGAWRGAAIGCKSGCRLLSSGYGMYNNWGFRAAMTAAGKRFPKEVELDLGKGVTMEFVYIKPGTFVMGGENTKDSQWWCLEVPKHEVTISKGFYMGKYEVTQAQYQSVMGSNPSRASTAPNCPVDNIGEADAIKFCEVVAGKTEKAVRLPTEAEWEYACRAGSKTRWFFGDNPSKLGDYAWFIDNDRGKSHPVGQKKPNPWGLYDICGNVWERVADRYAPDYYAKSPKVDPTGPLLKKKSLIEYKIDAPRAGKYELTAKVVTVNYGQHLIASANSGDETTIALPFTCGKWLDSKPITVTLKRGENTLQFYRLRPPQYGMAVKSFELKPVR